MLSSIYFLSSFIILFILLFLVKKLDISLSFTNSLVLCYIFLLCINTICALPLSVLSIPININTMSIVYNVLSLLLLLYIVKSKKLQIYHFDKFDCINFLIMLFFILAVFIRVFSLSINLAYANTDIANHFDFAMSIVRTGKLNTMYFASLNNALFIQVLEPIFSGIASYKSMIIAETVSNFLSGIIFYVLISYRKRGYRFKFISPIIMILYFVGWPLYQYVMGGFVYWGLGVSLFLFSFYLFYLYRDFPNIRSKLIPIFLLVLYCIAVCYILFLPYVLGLFLCNFLYLHLHQQRINTKKNSLLVLLFAIGIIGVILLICVLYYYFKDFQILLSFLAHDGGIHKELYRDYIYFLPLLYYIGTTVKEKKEINLDYFNLCIYFVFTVATFALCCIDIVSPYYYYKLYFILWALVWIVSCDAIDRLLQSSHSWIYPYSFVILFLAIFNFTNLDAISVDKKINERWTVEFPLYSATASYLKSPSDTIFDDKEYWELLYYLEENNLSLPIITDNGYFYWYTTFFNTSYYTSDSLNNLLITEPTSFVIDKDLAVYKDYIHILDNSYSILFENELFIIYQAIK